MNSSALVLSVRSFGEGHREASLLLPSKQSSVLLRASVFGGAKSKLKGLVIPYHSGTVWFYSNPVKNSNKITDFEVKNYRSGLRENLTRLWAAAFAAEIAEKLQGNVDWLLMNAFLNGLEVSSDEECRKAVLRFIWRNLEYSGLTPELFCCTRCGGKIEGSSYFIFAEDGAVCRKCINHGEFNYPLSGEARNYLFCVLNSPPKISREEPLSETAFAELRTFLFALIKHIAGSEFKTLETNKFIL